MAKKDKRDPTKKDEKEPQLYAYVFMHLVDPGRDIPGVLASLRRVHTNRRHPVRFAAPFVGSFIAFAAVEVDSLAELQSLVLNEFWEAGARSEWSLVLQESSIMGPHRGSPPYYAIVRVKTAPKRAVEVLGLLDRKYKRKLKLEPPGEFRYGAAVVSGRGFDIIVELGAESFEALTDSILGDLVGVDGIVSTDTSFTFLPENL